MPVEIANLLIDLDKGGATLIAAVLSAVISGISLCISIISSRAQTRLASRLSNSTAVSKESRDYKLKQLTSFYDPIYALLSANRRIFERIGPTSASRRDGAFNDEETAEVWSKLTAEVIVPNNMKVCEIIIQNLHFLSDVDDEHVYLEFLTHAHAYRVFKQNAYEAYRLFPYPVVILGRVEKARGVLRTELAKLYASSKT
jgi:hypothetical protein